MTQMPLTSPSLGSWTERVKQSTKLPRTAVARGGPVAAIVKSRRRYALPLWLFLIAVAHPATATANLRQFRQFARCLGMGAETPGELTRARLTRTIATLEDLRLVEVVDRGHKRFTVRLLALDGSGDPYSAPEPGTRTIALPRTFFQNLWHATLDPIELQAFLISLAERAYQFNKVGPDQWQKRRWEIARDYGLAESTWSRGKEGLYRRGLLEWELIHLPWALDRYDAPAVDRYTVHLDVLDLRPAEAPTYEAEKSTVTLSMADGTNLRLETRRRRVVENAPPAAAANVVTLRQERRHA